MLEMEEFADKTTPYSTLQLLRCRCKDLITAYIESVVPEPAEIMRKSKIIDFHFNEAIAQLKVLRDQETALLEKKDILRVARENCDKNDARKCQSKINANEKEIYWLQKQMVALNQKGFITWSRKFFLRFVEAFQRLGRFNIKAITQFVVGKSLQEVQEYSDVFWKRFEELEEDVIRNLASDVLDREMLMKLQRFMKIKGIPRNDNEIDYQLMLILRDIQWKDLKNVMGVIIHKSGELLKGKSKAVVRSRCNRLVKTYHFSLAFCNNGEVSYSQNEQKAPGLPPDSKNSVSLLKPLELRANDKPKSMKKAINPLYVVRKLHAVKELLPATTSATNNSNLVDLTSDDSMDGLSEASTSHFVSGLARGIKRPASLANDQENGPKKFKINLQHGAKNIIDALKAASKDPSRELPKNGFDDDDDSDIEIIE